MRRPGVLALASLWLVAAVAGVSWVVFVWSFGDLWCGHPKDDSNFGKLSWSILPPGHKCTWNERANGFAEVKGPGWHGSAYIIGVALAGGTTVFAMRRVDESE